MTPMARSAGEGVVAQLRRGDPAAVARVARLVALVINDKAYAIPQRDRPDVIQNVLVDLWRTLVKPDFAFSGNIDALVRTVAYRRCVDWLRRQRPADPLEDEQFPTGAHGPDGRLMRKERSTRGAAIVSRLSEACRALMHLRVVEELPHREIASRQGSTEDAVRSRFYKCVKAARRIAVELDGA